jgi:tol-pal system protein YbgF
MAQTPPPSMDRHERTQRTTPERTQRPRRGRGGVGLLLVGLFLLPLTACATKGDVRDLSTEIRELQARQEALIRELQAEQRILRDSIQQLSGQMGDHRIQLARTLRDLEDQLIRVQELAGLSQQELAALRDQMERRPLPTPGGPGFGGDQGGEPRGIFDDAMAQFRRGSLTSARFGFEEVVDRFPDHELAPSARYYLADIMVQEGDLDGAIQAFEQIAEFHPDSPRVANALYRIGLLYRERGETNEARSYLERVVNTWPDSDVADLARAALRELG